MRTLFRQLSWCAVAVLIAVPPVSAQETTNLTGSVLTGAGGAVGAATVLIESLNEVPPVAVPLPMLDPEPSVVPGVGAS